MQINYLATGIVFSLSLIMTGCSSYLKLTPLEDMESVALCREDAQGIKATTAITAEYGFKRFADNTFTPLIDQRLFGHKIRLVTITEQMNKLYVAGAPQEFGHHFGWLLKSVECDKNQCQAPIGKQQTLKIYKSKNKKSKNTTILECNKIPKDETNSDSK